MAPTPKSSIRNGTACENSNTKLDELHTRDYIIEMLAQLCELAKKSNQIDIVPFLNLSYLAIINSEQISEFPKSYK